MDPPNASFQGRLPDPNPQPNQPKKVKTPASLRKLASDKIKAPSEAKPISGAGVPIVVKRNDPKDKPGLYVSSLSGKGKILSYSTYPTICQLFKDVKIPNPQIALIPYYLDQLGDIRILLNIRLMIKERFGVEPLIIANLENILRTLDFLKNSKELEGLTFKDLDKIDSADCKGLDLLIHGPGIYGVELMSPESIFERYPALLSGIDQEHPPVLFSLLECESGNFSYSTIVDEVAKAERAISVIRTLLFKIQRHYQNFSSKPLPKDISQMLPWVLPILRGYRGILKTKNPDLAMLMGRFAAVVKFLIENPDPNTTTEEVIVERLENAFDQSYKIVKIKRFESFPDQISGMSSKELAKALIPQNKTESLVIGVQKLYELQMGLNPLFSLGWFKLPGNLQVWLDQGLIDTPEGRKSIFKGIVGQSKQENDLLKSLEKDPLTGVEKDSYYLGYGHSTEIMVEFIKQAKANNPQGQVVVNLDIEEAEKHFKDCNIFYYPLDIHVNNNSPFTIHLYNRLSNPVFDALMAASDPSCRLAGGDNTLFTTLMLGTDDLVYELRSFKQGMIIALFQLANELSEEEKNCIVDRMLETAPKEILGEMKDFMPSEYNAFLKRKAEGTLNRPGSPEYKSAFRKVGVILRERARVFNDNLIGFMNLQMLARREPAFISEVDSMVGDGQVLTKEGGFEKIKAHIDRRP